MQKMHIALSAKPVILYGLDTIISVGYRVKSHRGTQFRIWATRTLKDHLLRGYTLNEKRLREKGLGEIEQAVGLLAQTLTHHALVTGEALYPTVQARAAHLLYFVIKDHPFTDGNKRIGTLLFLEYLRRNGLLVRPDGTPRLADNAMVALALLVAESEPLQKDLMIRLILNLLEDGGG